VRFAGGIAGAAVVAVWLTVTTTLSAAPVQASVTSASCPPGRGVSVVIEFNGLDHEDVQACAESEGGESAARLLRDAGLALTSVQRQPGFVCRVSGLPEQDPCVNTPPADAYWSLWWSDGSSDSWTYAATGVEGLQVPAGGSVALVWDGRQGDVAPATAPGARASGSRAAPRDASGAVRGSTEESQPHDRPLPVWVAPAAIGLLFAAAAVTAVVRRRRGAAGT